MTVTDLMEDRVTLDGVLMKCNEHPAKARNDSDCLNARIAIERLAKDVDPAIEAKRNAEFHYALGPEFYRFWLDDPLMLYTCAYWKEGTRTLEEAQQNKLEHVGNKVLLRPGEDVVDIGSGFGGAITACRLAQRSKKVLVLERGRRWDRSTYPRKLEDDWIWSRTHPERFHGWADLRRFKGMAVIAGAGVGGGSLIYANVSAVPPPSVFESGWPAEITYAELQPYYDPVAYMLDIQRVPEKQQSPRVQLMRDAAEKLGQAQRFRLADLAVSFDQTVTYDFSVEPDIRNSIRFLNKHGVEQGFIRVTDQEWFHHSTNVAEAIDYLRSGRGADTPQREVSTQVPSSAME